MGRKRELEFILARYDNIEMMCKALDNGKVTEEFMSYQHSQSSNVSFTGTRSFEEANNLLKYGDVEGLKKIEEMGLNETRKNILRYKKVKRLYSSPVGFAPNVPAYISGSPNSMINLRVEKQRQKTITLLFDSTVPYYIGKNTIFQTAAQFLSAIMILEAKGIRVNLWCGCVCSDSSQKKQINGLFVNVKRAERKLDVLRLVYPVTNPSFLRRHFFLWQETTEGVLRQAKYVNDNSFEAAAKKAGLRYDKILRIEKLYGMSADEIVEQICK